MNARLTVAETDVRKKNLLIASRRIALNEYLQRACLISWALPCINRYLNRFFIWAQRQVHAHAIKKTTFNSEQEADNKVWEAWLKRG